VAALSSGPLLAALQNFAHQVFKQFTEKPGPAGAPAPAAADASPGLEH